MFHNPLHGHVGQESELKSQSAFEAARDPNSSVTAEDAEHLALNEAKKSGAAAYQFDPNASAEEKARQAKAAIPQEMHRKHTAAALVSDQDNGTVADYDLPPPTKEGALPPPSADTAIANGHVEEEDEWYKVGWAPRFGNPGETGDESAIIEHQTFLEGKLDDKFFGDWYHNTGIIIFACLTSWVIAVLGGGLGWVFLVMAFCGTYYRTSIRRVRRNFRDDINRKLAKTRLETDNESLEWINSFLVKFWPIYAPVLCATIVSSVDQVLSTSTPAFLDSMRMKFFTLGTKPPRLEHVKTYPKAEDDIVLMDWKFTFTPNDTADLTARQIKNKVNPKIVLEIRIGKGMVSKALDIIVEDMAFSGLMRVKVKLQIPFPHIEKVEICFLERPTIDYVCKPLGGDTFGFDINFIPGLETFIMEQVHANLGPMMYAPNVFPIEIAKMLAGSPVDQAIGVVQITFHGAQGLKNPDKFAGTPDPYAVVAINGREPLGTTKTVHENANPRWNETVNIIISSLKDSLTLQVYDWNEYRKDKELGMASFALDQLEHVTEHQNLELQVMANGRSRGLVQADIRFFPVLEAAKLPDGTLQPPPESTTGIAKFTIESAKELDGSKSLIGQLNPYAVLLLNGKEIHVSKKLKRTNNPIWPDATKELLITDRKTAKLGLVIKDDRGLATDPIIGTYQVKINDMIDLMSQGQEWYNLAGVQTGRAKMLLQWKPIALKGALGGSGGYVTPIGVLRLHLQSAKDLRNLETMGKSDPYARVLLSGVQKGRTVTFKNNLNPDWDEVIYVPVHSTREKLTIEVMDEESLGKDRSLGAVEVATSDYVQQDEQSGAYIVHDSKRIMSQPLQMGPRSQPKGTLVFTASFFPTLNVADPEDEDEGAKTVAAHPAQNGLDTTRTRSGTVGTISSLNPVSSHDSSRELIKQLAENEKEQQETALGEKKEVPKVRIGPEDLSQYESGLLVFKILKGEMAHIGCHLELIMDDNLFPAFSSARTRARATTFNEVGDVMVRELDLSRMTLRLVEEVDKKGEGKDERIKAKLQGDTLEVLKRSLYQDHPVVLKDKEGRESKITVNLRYLPVQMKLDPSESINNQGNLRVEVLDAADLPAADRNGYSDPFCKFRLGVTDVYKTKTQKKTLHPAWNEFFEVPIRSRTAGNFAVEVYDWDFGDKADFLGKATINLDILEPFQRQEVVLGLDGKSGTIRLAMLFKPDYVTRSRQGSSTFSGTFSTPGKIVGAPVKGVGKGAVLVSGGVAKGASFLGRGFRRGKSQSGQQIDSGSAVEPSNDEDTYTNGRHPLDSPAVSNSIGGVAAPSSSPAAGASDKDLPVTPNRRRSFGTAGTAGTPGADMGTATISVLSASGFPAGTKVEVRVLHDGPRGLKEVLKTRAIKSKTGTDSVAWDDGAETKRVPCSADAQFRLLALAHSTFGGSSELGEAAFFVDDQGSGGAEKLVKVGEGVVVIRSSFVADDAASVVGSVRDSPSGGAGRFHLGPGGGGKSLRHSLMGKRDRSVTPGAAAGQ